MTAVLCIKREEFNNDSIQNAYFIPRIIVDSQEEVEHTFARHYPQVLPYAMVKCGDKYLSYARKGSESRLHGKRSIGIGGHIEHSDSATNDIIMTALIRETEEELGTSKWNNVKPIGMIDSDFDKVSQVHIGAAFLIEFDSIEDIKPNPDELKDVQWLTMDELKQSVEDYEHWSALLINKM